MIRHIADLWKRCWWGGLLGRFATSVSLAAGWSHVEVHFSHLLAVCRHSRSSQSRNSASMMAPVRAGPDSTGFSRLGKFLTHNGLESTVALDRRRWQIFEREWVQDCPAKQVCVGHNFFSTTEAHMCWKYKCSVSRAFAQEAKPSFLDLVLRLK